MNKYTQAALDNVHESIKGLSLAVGYFVAAGNPEMACNLDVVLADLFDIVELVAQDEERSSSNLGG